MGYERTETDAYQAVRQGDPGALCDAASARAEFGVNVHDRNAPGLKQIAFNAESRAAALELHELPLQMDNRILDPPAEYLHFPRLLCALFRRLGRDQARIRPPDALARQSSIRELR